MSVVSILASKLKQSHGVDAGMRICDPAIVSKSDVNAFLLTALDKCFDVFRKSKGFHLLVVQ